MRTTWLAAICLTSLATGVSAQWVSTTPPAPQQSEAVTADQAAAVVNALADALEEKFVFPEVGKAYAVMLRQKVEIGAYSGSESRDAFAEAVTADLQALHKDGHLRLFAPKQAGAKSKYRTAPSADGAIGRSGWIADGVAYVEFTMFPGDRATLEKIQAFLDSHASAKALIIDIRGHHGGDIKEVDLIGSYLFSKEEELGQMDTRAAVDAAGASPFEDGATIRRVSGPEGVVRRKHVVVPASKATALRQAQVYVLTSKKTASAAEHFAMGMKRTGRATLVGETTVGAGHFGSQYSLPNGYSAFIPVGRSFDPTTGQGWEGTGVVPNVAVAADKALDEALRLAGAMVSGALALARLK